MSTLQEVKDRLEEIWEPYGGYPASSCMELDAQIKHSSQPAFVLFIYVPVVGFGPFNVRDFSGFNEAARDSNAYGYNFTSARIQSLVCVRLKGDGIKTNRLHEVMPYESKPEDSGIVPKEKVIGDSEDVS